MVAVKAHQAAAFLRAPPSALTAALFFGSDAGLVSENAATFAAMLAGRETPKGEVLRLDDTELDESPDRLELELRTRPMFSGRIVVRAIAGRRITAQLLKPLLAEGNLEGLLVVEAGNLKPDDSLRALFERSPTAAAVACYPDSAADIDELISQVLGASGLKIDLDARAMLQTRLGADRGLSRAELEKLALYCLGRTSVGADDIAAAVGDAADLALDRIAEAAAEGRTRAALTDYGRLLAAGESAQAIIASLQRYFLKLYKVRVDIDAGQRLDDALKAMRPPVFFKQRDAFAKQLRAWTRADLEAAIRRIAEAAKAARLSAALEDAHGERLVLALGQMASARQSAAAGR